MAKRDRILNEIQRLEKELTENSDNHSERQVAYKRRRLKKLKKQLAKMDAPKEKQGYEQGIKNVLDKKQQQEDHTALEQKQLLSYNSMYSRAA